MKPISGIHHVTAIAGDPQKNIDFYAGTLGLRLVKLTVNFDDPSTYHLYYGDYSGSPGTLITFFPWRGIPQGRPGAGEVAVTSFSVPAGSLEYWRERLGTTATVERRFEESALLTQDMDGMRVELVASDRGDDRSGWAEGPIPASAAIRGFHSATLAAGRFDESVRLITDTMGYIRAGQEADRHRFIKGDGGPNRIVDLVAAPGTRALQGAGSVHHIAFRVDDDASQSDWRELLVREGLGVSPVMDRKYFHSIYYREPSGILYEIATDPPGMTLDEPLETLGSHLVLPPWLEPRRAELVSVLPKLQLPEVAHA